MPLVAIAVHVGMGTLWVLVSLAVAISGRAQPSWLRLLLVVALCNMLAGIYLWHTQHAGAWGSPERLLVVGTFCAFVALGLQTPIALLAGAGRLTHPALTLHRVSAFALVAAAAAMIGSRWA